MSKNTDIYGGRDPREVGMYSAKDLSRFLQIARSTIRYWVSGRTSAIKKYAPIIVKPSQDSPLLSFNNAIELHVLHRIRVHHGVLLPKVRSALDYVRDELEIEHPLLNARFKVDGVDLFVEHLGELVNASDGGQMALWKEALNQQLDRVEFDENDIAARISLGLGSEEYQPRSVVIDPLIAFGKPVLRGTRIRTSILRDRFQGGESMESIARDYGQSEDSVNDAIRCELMFAA